VLKNPANRHKAVVHARAVALRVTNTFDEDESRRLYER
jgi:hypothetical protein